MDLCIVVITKNRHFELRRLITNVLNQKINYNYEMIIVDASSDDIFLENKIILTNKTNTKHIKSSFTNKALQRNIGVKHSIGHIILFLDDDVILNDNYLKNITDIIYKRDDIIGLTGFVQNQKKYSLFEKYFRFIFLLQDVNSKNTHRKISGYFSFNNNPQKLQQTNCLWGCNMAIKKSYFNKICFDEHLSFFDDLDISLQIQSFGGKLYITNNAKLLHCRSRNMRISPWKIPYYQFISMLKIILGHKEYFRLIFFLWSFVGTFIIIFYSLITNQDITKGTYIDYEKCN